MSNISDGLNLDSADGETDLLAIALQLGQLQAGFLGQIAHELRSPMSHIMSLQQLILADLCEDLAEEREFIAQCYVASQKFMELLDLAVDVSKLDYGTSHPRIKLFDFPSLIRELEALLTVKAKSHNVKFSITHPSHSVLEIEGDRHRIQQFFLTLLNTTVNQTEIGDIQFSYEITPTKDINFQLRSPYKTDFWEKTNIRNITLSERPTPTEVQQLAQGFEFSPAIKWQLCQKLIAAMGGTLTRTIQDKFIQVTGQIPRPQGDKRSH